jgi:hypothetical protein
MKCDRYLQGRIFAPALVLALLLNPLAHAFPQESSSPSATDQQTSNPATPQGSDQTAPPAPDATPPDSAPKPNDLLPDSPSASQAQSGQGTAQPAPQTQEPPQAQPQPENRGHEPLGTAAAESIPTSGVAASRPAGAALAPAKQRRIRSILIKTGALVGVGVAVGATMALSEGSPSKPPGSH